MARRSAPRAKKSLGQHFLRDEAVLRDIAGALQQPERSLVLEVGPGTGQLTAALLAAKFRVVAVERDQRMLGHLERRFQEHPNLTLVEGDARDVSVEELIPHDQSYAMAGNLPYFAANPIVRHFLEHRRPPEEVVVMVQREVAREMSAPAGKFSMLSIGIQTFARAETLFDVAATAFDPPPKVVSTVVRLVPLPQPLVPKEDRETFFKLVRGAFRHSRKQLHNALVRGTPYEADEIAAALEASRIESTRRPETLTIAEWQAVVKGLLL